MVFVPLDPVTGPECTRCGCRDCVVLSEPSTTSYQSAGTEQTWTTPGKAICKHCNCRFPFVSVAPARQLYAGPNCPDCGCDDTKCTHTYPPKEIPIRKRRHVCKQCGTKFVTESPE